MSRNHKISDMGLKLIKAYEGYRAVDRELVTGQRVVGYGHRLYNDDARHLNKSEAESLLIKDLAPFEDMINENVHTPLNQSQFDALCSFAFNIGPKAFLQSDVLRALNNGRPLDAANGFDIWRKSTIDGKTYVVDALLRRRTAEKALFLRTENGKPFAAPRVDLEPVRDEAVALLTTEDALPVFTQDKAAGVVATVPYSAAYPQLNQSRRRDDVSDMAESERDLEADTILGSEDDAILDLTLTDEIESEVATERASTMIAEAASELSEKLEALIDDASYTTQEDIASWPESLIKAGDKDDFIQADSHSDEIKRNVIELAPQDSEISTSDEKPADIVIDEMAADDAIRESRDSASKYIEITEPMLRNNKVGWGYWLTLLVGFAILGASIAAILRGVEGWLQGWGPLVAFSGLIVGGVLVLAALIYAIRASLR